MSNPAKERGHRFERAVVEYLRAHGQQVAERAYGEGRSDDQGDIRGVTVAGEAVAIQAKDWARFVASEWLGDAETQRINARARFGIAVAKRRGKGAGEAYVVMTLETFAEMLGRCGA